jgi:DNA-binding NtrC family response regulator
VTTLRLTGSGKSGSREPAPIRVEATHGPGKGAQRVLERGTLIVGGDASADLRLDDPAVSRRHAQLELLYGAVHVRDLGSRNGTRYLGAKVQDARVPLGGSVVVGRTTLSLAPLDEGQPSASDRDELFGLVGRSAPMRRLFGLLERVGPTDATALILGESGTGKDHVARAVHALSRRSHGPFVVLDCAALAPGLVESELFGHARGAFSDAAKARAGALEQAHGGTLLLDEIGELPLALQPKLLRFLERRELKRLGENQVRKVDVRVLAATHRPLEQEVSAGRFRQDLYFRLAVALVVVPPLRQRADDIPLLAALFAQRLGGPEAKLPPATVATLQCEAWPGNVRELRNAVERALSLGSAKAPAAAGPGGAFNFHQAREQLLEQFEREFLESLLKRHVGNTSAAAREAGMARSHFYRLLEKHGLKA